ncbi:MAG: ion channel [Actinomycetes bacterium]
MAGVAFVVGRSHAIVVNQGPPVVPLIWTVLAFLALLRRLLTHRRVDRATLFGAISAYLLIPLAFFYLFLMVNSLGSEAFFGRQAETPAFMYFSLTTLTTVGSDLQPANDLGRLLTATESIAGQLFLVTFVAMIVGLMATRWRSSDSA